jgi:hypothetical protein
VKFRGLLFAGVAGGKDGAFVVALTNLFKDVADAVDANEEFLRESFGADAILEVMSGLQEECDVQVCTAFNPFHFTFSYDWRSHLCRA